MKRIAVVDDDSEVRAVLVAILLEEGYEVLEASNGIEAMQLVRSHPIELMILDMLMPEMDGLETISALGKASVQMKIIAITGGGRISPENYLQMAKAMGANRTITKPFHYEEIADSVKELLAEFENSK